MKRYFDMDRRQFLKVGATLSSGLVLGTHLLSVPRAQAGVLDQPDPSGLRANLFVALRLDGSVEITCHRSDMGQQIRTAIAQIVADEMEADWQQVHVIQAPGDAAYGDQNTDGSRSIRFNFERLRKLGASARAMLEQAAANRWQVEVATCKAQNHQVTHASGKQLSFAELAQEAVTLTPPKAEQLTLKPRSEWRYIRTGKASIDLPDIVQGQATFAADVRLPDTKVAVIARPPVVFGTIKSLDDKAARAIDGVIDIVRLPESKAPAGFYPKGGVAVIADNTWAANKARQALKIEWNDGDNAAYNSPAYKQSLLETVRQPAARVRAKGDARKALSGASLTHEAEYYVPHLAQAPMEPPCATARYAKGAVEVWAATQNPQADQSLVAELLELDKDKVTIHVTLLGGGFGRKSKPDFSAEAALLAKHIGGTVRVQWTREDDIQHSYYHAVSAQRLEAALTPEGKIDAFYHRTAFSPIASTFTAGETKPESFELDLGFTDSPIHTPNLLLERGEARAMTRIGWMRSVSNIFHAFAVQSFLNELAHKANQDPKDFLLKAIGPDRHIDFAAQGATYANYSSSQKEYPYDTARLRQVIEKVAEMADWGREMPKGRGLGIAAHRSFVTYVATVVEVEVSDSGKLDIIKTWVAIDAGAVVNTDTVVNQCEGGSIFGLSCALSKGITFNAGRAEQSNFHDYRVARMNESPLDFEVSIIDSDAPPAGVGEPPTPPFAPALCNAIYAACGKRIRELPIGDQLKS